MAEDAAASAEGAAAAGGVGAEEASAADAAGKDRQQQTKALSSITDVVEEKQLDATRVQRAMQMLSAKDEASRQAQLLREKELAAVKINQADVDLIATEMELDKKVAERTLREHKGDTVAALRSLLT
eukprot:jgi/Chlat1/4902/Chrsp31S04914